MSVHFQNMLIFSAYMSPLGVAFIRVIQPIQFAKLIWSMTKGFSYRRPAQQAQIEEPALTLSKT